MSRTINVDLDPASINAAILQIRDYQEWIKAKANELTRRLAEIGAAEACITFSDAMYDGNNDTVVMVEPNGDNGYAVKASGTAVLFIEFGAGITYGYGHPDPEVEGVQMGPGTYPTESIYWAAPEGWYYAHDKHTYGNPPSMAMYNAANDMRDKVLEVAREVFRT